MFFWQKKDNSFKGKFTFEERKKLSSQYLEKFPTFTPMICEPSKNSRLPEAKDPKIKYIVAPQVRMFIIMQGLRTKISLNQYEALYVFAKQGERVQLLKSDTRISEVYANFKDEDGFLYLEYKGAEWTG